MPQLLISSDDELAWALSRRAAGTGGRPREMIVFAVMSSLNGWSPAPRRGALFAAGALSGLMGTAVSTGAAPVALLYQRSSGRRLRAALSAFFFVGTGMSLVILALFGLVGTEEIGLAAVLTPAVAVGVVSSRWAVRLLDAGRTRVAVLTVSSIAALALLVRAAVS